MNEMEHSAQCLARKRVPQREVPPSLPAPILTLETDSPARGCQVGLPVSRLLRKLPMSAALEKASGPLF